MKTTELAALASRGLSHGFIPDEALFAQTVRRISNKYGSHLVREGINLRYTAIAALGLNVCPADDQHSTLEGRLARDLLPRLVDEAAVSDDVGAVALSGWAVAEITGAPDGRLLNRMRHHLLSTDPLATVDTAWMLTAAVAALRCAELPEPSIALATEVAEGARRRLLDAQGEQGIFAHAVPAASQGRWRAHIGCFADQIYPVQALARWADISGDPEALRAADRTAQRLCDLQGESGEWWWHYDTRTGDIVEGFPVYSVHQHAMAPMALMDLAAAGGRDHGEAIERGLGWLTDHPETRSELISEEFALIWRKVGRREPPKAARALSAVTTSLRPGWTLDAVDRLLPPGPVDHECRPYELGWLLYAWLHAAPSLERSRAQRETAPPRTAATERRAK